MICQLFVTDCLLYKECDVGESFREPEGRFENRWLISKLHQIEKGNKTLKFSLCLMSETRTNHPSTELQQILLWFSSFLLPFLCWGGGHVGVGDVRWEWREVLQTCICLCSKGMQWPDLAVSPHLLAADFFVSVLLVVCTHITSLNDHNLDPSWNNNNPPILTFVAFTPNDGTVKKAPTHDWLKTSGLH